YEPSTGTWSATGAMTIGRTGHAATRLADGRVLVSGGDCQTACDPGGLDPTDDTAEVYHPATGTWTAVGSMHSGRQYHTQTLMRSGWVLAVGGFTGCDDSFCSSTSSADLFDPASG